MELSEKAKELLKTATPEKWCGHDMMFIERTLGWKTWDTAGKKWNRPDIAELYREGLISELFHPGCPPVFVTEKGIKVYRQLMDLDTK
jgi:hypothetical protein